MVTPEIERKTPKFPVIGHRGNGMNVLQSSDRKMRAIKENTIVSFNAAAKFDIDYIEFDVQVGIIVNSSSRLIAFFIFCYRQFVCVIDCLFLFILVFFMELFLCYCVMKTNLVLSFSFDRLFLTYSDILES